MDKAIRDRKTKISGISIRVLVLLIIFAVPLLAEYVELGAGGTLLMNVPYCGG